MRIMGVVAGGAPAAEIEAAKLASARALVNAADAAEAAKGGNWFQRNLGVIRGSPEARAAKAAATKAAAEKAAAKAAAAKKAAGFWTKSRSIRGGGKWVASKFPKTVGTSGVVGKVVGTMGIPIGFVAGVLDRQAQEKFLKEDLQAASDDTRNAAERGRRRLEQFRALSPEQQREFSERMSENRRAIVASPEFQKAMASAKGELAKTRVQNELAEATYFATMGNDEAAARALARMKSGATTKGASDYWNDGWGHAALGGAAQWLGFGVGGWAANQYNNFIGDRAGGQSYLGQLGQVAPNQNAHEIPNLVDDAINIVTGGPRVNTEAIAGSSAAAPAITGAPEEPPLAEEGAGGIGAPGQIEPMYPNDPRLGMPSDPIGDLMDWSYRVNLKRGAGQGTEKAKELEQYLNNRTNRAATMNASLGLSYGGLPGEASARKTRQTGQATPEQKAELRQNAAMINKVLIPSRRALEAEIKQLSTEGRGIPVATRKKYDLVRALLAKLATEDPEMTVIDKRTGKRTPVPTLEIFSMLNSERLADYLADDEALIE